MLKVTAIVSLILIVAWSQAVARSRKRDGSDNSQYTSGGVWASGLSCDSCGSECMSACGTRHFRACCFNYLRKKRGNIMNEGLKMWSTKNQAKNTFKKLPLYAAENTPDMTYLAPILMTTDLESNMIDDTDNHLQFYDV